MQLLWAAAVVVLIAAQQVAVAVLLGDGLYLMQLALLVQVVHRHKVGTLGMGTLLQVAAVQVVLVAEY
jgi:hypothetical protein